MRKFLIILSILLFAPIASASSNYLVTESAPVNPGDTTYVYVPIKNLGHGTNLYDVSVKLVPKDSASTNAVTLLNDVDTLGTIEKWGEERTAKFRIHINPETLEGDYYFDVYVTSRGIDGTALSTTKLEDRILTIKGTPKIMFLNSTLRIVEPISINRETLTIKNKGTGTIENAVFEISLADNEMKSVFSILGSGTQFFIGNLKAGDEVEIVFDLAVDIAALPGVYNLPVKITGQNNYSSTDYIGLVVGGKTDFEISYQETIGSLSLNVANIGVNPASAVTVSVPRQENYSVSGSSSSVLGNLNPGDYTSAIFQVTKKGTGNVLEVEIQYTDTSGKRHKEIKTLLVDLSSATAQAGTSGSGGTSFTTWLLVITGVIIVYWQRIKIITYYRKFTGKAK
ncbi:MAG: COG1361 S-layer family protein [Candidatus Methanoperedens sp.]